MMTKWVKADINKVNIGELTQEDGTTNTKRKTKNQRLNSLKKIHEGSINKTVTWN